MKPEQFLDLLLVPAQDCQRKTGVPASLTLAQAALESRWGESELARSGCNLFGVKADKSWHGPVTVLRTKEHIGGGLTGKDVTVVARWRCYANWLESMVDHAQFFHDNPRYAACFKETTGEGWAHAVAAAGYATDPLYAQKLVAVMRGRNLGRFDK